MKVGIVTTRGLGDIVVAIPIAYHFIRQRGDQVYWPIDATYLKHFELYFPEINWLPVIPEESAGLDPASSVRYYLDEPIERLTAAGVTKDNIKVLYQQVTMFYGPGQAPLSAAMKFDEIKYAIAGVPLKQKWNLDTMLRRHRDREESLFNQKWPRQPYCISHLEGSDQSIDEQVLAPLSHGMPVVKITLGCDIWDWLTLIERASRIVCIDSVYANIIDMLGIQTPKVLFFRAKSPPPVLREKWQYAWPNPPKEMTPKMIATSNVYRDLPKLNTEQMLAVNNLVQDLLTPATPE